MDNRYFEFWGQLFLSIAKGQKQMEDADAWFRQAFKGYEPLASMFKKAYGLDGPAESSPEYNDVWRDAAETFQKNFRESLGLLDILSKEDHLALM